MMMRIMMMMMMIVNSKRPCFGVPKCKLNEKNSIIQISNGSQTKCQHKIKVNGTRNMKQAKQDSRILNLFANQHACM